MAAYSYSKSGLKTGQDFSKEAYFGNGYINELEETGCCRSVLFHQSLQS